MVIVEGPKPKKRRHQLDRLVLWLVVVGVTPWGIKGPPVVHDLLPPWAVTQVGHKTPPCPRKLTLFAGPLLNLREHIDYTTI